MNLTRIHAILAECLGEVDSAQNPLPGSEVIDVWMLIPLKVAEVREHAAEMIELLKDWPRESLGQSVPPLGQEINYLIAGAVLDSQQYAFMLFAFGKLLGWWDILDPHTVLGLEKSDTRAQRLAGQGLVAIVDYRPRLQADSAAEHGRTTVRPILFQELYLLLYMAGERVR